MFYIDQGPGLLKDYSILKSKPSIWLAGRTAANQWEAMVEKPCQLTWNLTWILPSNPQPKST